MSPVVFSCYMIAAIALVTAGVDIYLRLTDKNYPE